MTSSNTSPEPKTTRTLIDETVDHLVTARDGFNQAEFLIAIKDALRCRDLPTDSATVEAIEKEVYAKSNTEDPFQNIVKDGEIFTWNNVKDILPGYFKENLFHLINAEQGAGKSTLMLAFFRALISDEQTGNFLNLEVRTSKNWRLYLIAPDMPRESWATPLIHYGLITGVSKDEQAASSSGHLDSRVTLACSDVPYSLSPEHILEYRQMALDSVARGEQPLFVFDSYSTLVGNFKSMNEIDSQFAQPLQDLQKAMAGTGATTIVLHHTAKSRSGSTASSGSGTNRLGRIPDVVIELEAVSRNSNRMFLTSSKRVAPTSLIIEQDFQAGQWICHGDAKQAMALRELLQKIDSLKGPKERIYEWAQQRWENQHLPFTVDQVTQLIEKSVQTARTHVRVMESQGVIFHCDDEPTATKPRPVYLPTEYKQEWLSAKAQVECETGIGKNGKRMGKVSESLKPLANSEYERREALEREKAGVPSYRQPETNAYGKHVPRAKMLVEDANGENSLVIVEVVSQTDVKVQKLGDEKSPVKTQRWMLDVFPCGYHSINEDEPL